MRRVEMKEEDPRPKMEKEDSEYESQLADQPQELVYIPKSKRKEAIIITYRGIIESGHFNVNQSLSLLYTSIASENWKVLHGQKSGISQNASQNGGKIIWNFPFQITYETVKPEGWPQMMVIVYGKDYFGRSIVKGYGNIHLPVSSGSQTRKLRIFKTIPPTTMASCCAFLMGYINELKEPEKVFLGEGREYLQTKMIGELTLKIQARHYNFQNQGFQ